VAAAAAAAAAEVSAKKSTAAAASSRELFLPFLLPHLLFVSPFHAYKSAIYK